MKNKTNGDSLVARGIALTGLARAGQSSPPSTQSGICIVGVGNAGARLLDTLMDEDYPCSTAFLRAALMGETAEAAGGPWEPIHIDSSAPPIATADLVLILCCAHDVSALRMSAVVANAARQACAVVVGLLVPAPALQVDRATVLARFAGTVDVLVVLPPEPPPAVLKALLDALRRAVEVDHSGSARLNARIGGNLLDLRTMFAGCGRLCIGSASSAGAGRAGRAAARAIADLDLPRLARVTGVLLLVAGPPSMRLDEIHDVTCVIQGLALSRAEMVLGVFYGKQYGDTLRVTVVAGFQP